MDIGEHIKLLRKHNGMTLRDLAESVNLSHSYLSQIENGRRNASPEILKKLAETLNASYTDLLKEAGYLEQMKTIEEAVETLNLLWASPNEEYKLVIEDTTSKDCLELDKLLNQDISLLYKGHELSPTERDQVLKMLEVLFPDN